ncbi:MULTISPECIES: YqaA family protein [unclassified Bosea (in: a-proteobacteria)]|uniref:YqaA family protein n=1 Tax=unclassified Bosea (in: a-proteobacteria) TaxID=2653178 RepID=UPI000956D6DF|nr:MULTISPECIES: YqaA family protein [unclassified Bosea (in: a-proteobacteria)]TAJ29714.1 MAG: DedA family protein [Bosea sp. (in: a-proteobacteria)]SIQ58257.1 membrane protein YqaA, SNARE-associated domain [Bosea sp. TND4EK4]
MIRRLYEWTMSLAARPRAQLWLAIVAFVESSFFLIPADVLFVPMALARPARAYRLAAIATLFSVLGGIMGYAIGYYAFEALAKPVLAFYGKLGAFDTLRACAGPDTTLILLTTSGLAHLPPIKVVTILAGAVHIGLVFFVVSCVLARGARFFALAFLLRRYGGAIRHFIERRLKVIAVAAAGLLILLYFGLKLVAGSGQLFSC